MTASSLRWPLLALLGLVVAVAIAFLATRAVSTDIGISSEPPTAGRALSPVAPRRPRPHPTTTRTTASPPVTTVTVPSSGGGGSGGGGGGGGEGGDD